tara:strand:- start:259 stop:678 length:420 start_codon:yes stop_codon:yes gene_type:complete
MKRILILIVISCFFSNHSFAGWFDKDKIKVSKCYDTSNFKSYKDYKKKAQKSYWEADINLKEDMVVITSVYDGKVSMIKAMIDMKTDKFIGTYPDMTHQITFLFDLKREGVTSRLGPNVSDKQAKLMGGRETILKCKFN